MKAQSDKRGADGRYPYAEHDNGVVLTQPRPGEFERRPMTPPELAAREPALKIAKEIYRHANQAGVCYYEFWRLIADAIEGFTPSHAREKLDLTDTRNTHERNNALSTTPRNTEQATYLGALITEYHNTSFDCGAWDEEDGTKYEDVQKACVEAKRKLLEEIARIRTSPSAIRRSGDRRSGQEDRRAWVERRVLASSGDGHPLRRKVNRRESDYGMKRDRRRTTDGGKQTDG